MKIIQNDVVVDSLPEYQKASHIRYSSVLSVAKIWWFCPHKSYNRNFVRAINMPGPSNTLLIEGSFEELADELAHYVDEVQKKQTPDSANVQAEIAPLLEKGQKDEVLKKIVTASDVLNTAPEKGEKNQL